MSQEPKSSLINTQNARYCKYRYMQWQ